MIDRAPILALLALASLPAAAAAPPTERNFTVTSFDRIRVDGPYKVTLRTDVAPYARATGAGYAIDGLSLKVEGRTLVIRIGNSGWGSYNGESRGPVMIEVGTHELSAAYINGAGMLDIDRVSGLGFELWISGSGMARIDDVDVDQMRVGISGAGTSRLSGRAAKLNTSVRGTSTFDADRLQVTDAEITAEGPSTVRMAVSNSAKVDAFGLVSVTLTGNPACTVKAHGSASVVGCQEGRF